MALSDMKTAAVVHWPLDEASGDAIDSIGAVDLDERNTVGTGTGLFYGGARDFESGENDALTLLLDNATLSVGDIDFFWVAWVKPESSGATVVILAKGDTGTAANLPYDIQYQSDTKVLFLIGNGAGSSTTVTTDGTIAAGSWHLVIVYHDAANNLIGVSIDGGAFKTTACSHGSFDDGQAFVLGDLTMAALVPFDGLMQDIVLGKSYVPTDADATALWNGGTGVAFADWDAGGAATLPHYLNLLGCGI